MKKDIHVKSLNILGPQAGTVTFTNLNLSPDSNEIRVVKNAFVKKEMSVFITLLEVDAKEAVTTSVANVRNGEFSVMIFCPKENCGIVNSVTISFFISS